MHKLPKSPSDKTRSDIKERLESLSAAGLSPEAQDSVRKSLEALSGFKDPLAPHVTGLRDSLTAMFSGSGAFSDMLKAAGAPAELPEAARGLNFEKIALGPYSKTSDLMERVAGLPKASELFGGIGAGSYGLDAGSRESDLMKSIAGIANGPMSFGGINTGSLGLDGHDATADLMKRFGPIADSAIDPTQVARLNNLESISRLRSIDPEIYTPALDIADIPHPMEGTNALLGTLLEEFNDLKTVAAKQATDTKALAEASAAMLAYAGKEAEEARKASRASRWNLGLAAITLVVTVVISLWSALHSDEGAKETTAALHELSTAIQELNGRLASPGQ